MEVNLTPEQEAFVRNAIQTGRFAKPEDAVTEAMRLWEDRERNRAEIIAAVDAADASLQRGEGYSANNYESSQQLADDIKRRGRETRTSLP